MLGKHCFVESIFEEKQHALTVLFRGHDVLFDVGHLRHRLCHFNIFCLTSCHKLSVFFFHKLKQNSFRAA